MTHTTTQPNTCTLRVTCAATTGIIAAVTGHLATRGDCISELQQYDDEDTRRFFMRCNFQCNPDPADEADLLGPTASRHGLPFQPIIFA